MKKAVDPLTEMKRELTALTKKVAALEKQQAKADKCGDVTCTSLTVVDSKGKTVASIDGKGNVFCRTVWVATNPNELGVLLDGDNGSVQCLQFALRMRDSNTKLVEIDTVGKSPRIQLRHDEGKVGVSLYVSKEGGVVRVTDSNGRDGVEINATEFGSMISVQQPSVGQGGVILQARYVEGGDGVVITKDRSGHVTSWTPPTAEGDQKTILAEKDVKKSPGRKHAKK